MSAENEVPAGEIRLFDSQWSNIVNGETTVEGAVKATEKAMRRNFEDGAFPPPRAFFTKTITDLQSSLAEKDETIAVNEYTIHLQNEQIAELRARCAAAERDAARWLFVKSTPGYAALGDLSDEAIDERIAAQHAQRKEGEK